MSLRKPGRREKDRIRDREILLQVFMTFVVAVEGHSRARGRQHVLEDQTRIVHRQSSRTAPETDWGELSDGIRPSQDRHDLLQYFSLHGSIRDRDCSTLERRGLGHSTQQRQVFQVFIYLLHDRHSDPFPGLVPSDLCDRVYIPPDQHALRDHLDVRRRRHVVLRFPDDQFHEPKCR